MQAGARYNWNIGDQAFTREEQGDYGENEIKILRLATGVELAKMKRIKTEVDLWEKVLNLARIMAKN